MLNPLEFLPDIFSFASEAFSMRLQKYLLLPYEDFAYHVTQAWEKSIHEPEYYAYKVERSTYCSDKSVHLYQCIHYKFLKTGVIAILIRSS